MTRFKTSRFTLPIKLALLTASITPCVASADIDFFGKAHLSFARLSEDNAGTQTSSTAITSHASRVGVQGSLDTDSSTTFIYRFVWQVDLSDESREANLRSREQYVGLKDNWGQVRIGRDDSPYKKAGKKSVEHLSDSFADYNNIIDRGQDTRNNDSIGYWGKIGQHSKFAIQYAAGDDAVTAENAGQSYSLAYDAKIGAITFAVAYQNIERSTTNDETGTKLVFGYKLGDTQFGVIGEQVEDDGTLDDSNLLFSVKHNFNNKNALKFVYGVKDSGRNNSGNNNAGNADDPTLTALAFEHKLGKKVSVYALWADGADGGLSDAAGLEDDSSVFALGVIAKF